jgi:GTP diphosphokinase / guanosine-3',5'-bis(diphosphate) 3'-diphosphatase
MSNAPDAGFDYQVNYDLLTTSAILIRRINERFNGSDVPWVERGRAFAEQAHAGQYRGDGSPYAIHPFRVALLALDFEAQCTKEILVSCLLHDVVEDTEITAQDVSREFGSVVGNLVSAVTRYRPQNEAPVQRRASKLAKWHQTMTATRDVRLIKTLDYCDNIISCKFIAPDKPAFAKIPRWLMEAENFHLPLAERTNTELARLIETELRQYLADGHKIGRWLDET